MPRTAVSSTRKAPNKRPEPANVPHSKGASKWLLKDNFVAFLAGKSYDARRLQTELTQTITLALRKNRFPPPAFSHMSDLVGEMFAAMKAKPPDLSGDDWFIQMYRLARRTASKYFRQLAPKEERVSDPDGYVISTLPCTEEGLYIEQCADIPESYEAYITALDLDIDDEDLVYRVMDSTMFNSDPEKMDLSLRRVVLFAAMM